MFKNLKLWWNSLSAIDKVNAVFKAVTATATVAGAAICVHEVKAGRNLVAFAVDSIGDSVEVEVSQELVDTAVTKATEKQIARTVQAAVDRDWRAIQEESRKKVGEAVEKSRDRISEAVAGELAKECEKVHKADILGDIRDKAKDVLAEKLDSKLDEITDEYSKNLNNMGKVYEALADKLNSKA